MEPTSQHTPLNKFEPAPKYDAIIIGSGIGGMACAAALAKFGRRCLLLEQHYVPGGFTHTFSRKGYSWDVGVHCVGEMGPRDIPGKLLRWLSDGAIQWQSMGPVYERFHLPDGFEIEFPSDPQGFRQALEDKFPSPRDRESIDRYFKAVREAVAEAKPFFAFRALPRWLGHAGSKLVRTARRSDLWHRTTAEVLEEIVPNPSLRAVLVAQWGYYGSVPSRSSFAIHAMTVTHFMRGGYYPVGGAGTIAAGLLKTVRDAGGETVTRASVEQILLKNGRAVGVRLADGREIHAPKIISAAGAKITVDQLLPPESLEGLAWAREIRELRQSPPHVCLHLGIEGDLRAAGATPANRWFVETWDTEVADWDVRKPDSVAPALYMSFPTLKDPLHDPGPSQRHTAEVVTFVPWEAFEKWKGTRRGFRDPEYQAFKKQLEDRMIAQLDRHCPRIMKLVKYHELSTPLSTVHFTRAVQGAIYGLEATPRRFTTPHLRTRTPIRGLYLAGGDVTTLGVTGALVGGILCAATLEPRVFAKLT